jgi:hypothetical protein
VNHIFKTLLLVFPLTLSGCISIELPHLVSDTANASVNAYQNLTGKKDAKKRDDPNTVSYSYIGNNSQSVGDMKQNCETQAAQQLRQRHNNMELRYTLLENEIIATKDTISANCKVALAK